jgi:hypothetical protein
MSIQIKKYGFTFFLFMILTVLITLIIISSCKTQTTEPEANNWEISGTWQNVKPYIFTNQNFEWAQFILNVRIGNDELKGSAQTDFTTTSPIDFIIYEGSFIGNTIVIHATNYSIGIDLHLRGTLKELKRNDNGEIVKVISAQMYFDYYGQLTNNYQLYLIKQEIIYKK